MKNSSRRLFIKSSIMATGGAVIANPLDLLVTGCTSVALKTIRISKVNANFERESLIRPFGFKGGYMTEIWQTASFLKNNSGNHSIGLCTQNVLWSDAQVFASHSESRSNALMFALTEELCR